MTRPAPYSGEVEAALNAGRWPELYVFTGPRAHDQAHRRRIEYGPGSAIALPDGEAPENFDWPRVVPVEVIVDHPDPGHRAALARRVTVMCASAISDRVSRP